MSVLKKKERVNKPNKTLFIVVCFVVLLCVVFWGISKKSNSIAIPDHLLGQWISSAPLYEERYFEFSATSLVFATSIATVDTYFITRINSTVEEKKIFFTIDCHNDQKVEFQFSFTYQDDNGGIIIFNNQPNIKWVKKDFLN